MPLWLFSIFFYVLKLKLGEGCSKEFSAIQLLDAPGWSSVDGSRNTSHWGPIGAHCLFHSRLSRWFRRTVKVASEKWEWQSRRDCRCFSKFSIWQVEAFWFWFFFLCLELREDKRWQTGGNTTRKPGLQSIYHHYLFIVHSFMSFMCLWDFCFGKDYFFSLSLFLH